MSRILRSPLGLVVLTVAAAAVVLVFLSAEAQAPPAAPSGEDSQALTEPGSESPQVTTLGVANGFQDRLAADAPGATALAFAPDGRLLVTDREGRVRVAQEGSSNTTVALDISSDVCSNSERGLLGLALDPAFEKNGFVYLYYTYKKYGVCPEKEPQQNNNPVNRVARFVMEGNTIAPDIGNDGPGEVLINNIPSPNGNHNAGDLHFGKDGKLYVSTGDGSCNALSPKRCQPENETSRYRNILNGKILRVNTNGSIPNDNPYAGSSNGVRCGTLTNDNAAGGSVAAPGKICKETFAWGFRNPFRFAIDPDAQGLSLRVNDVGGARIEEVDQVRAGGDYGWNCREGTLVLNTTAPCPGKSMVKPINQYRHSTGCSSITGGAFVPNGAGWPSSYRDAYLFGDYSCGKIFKLKPKSGGGFERTNFATGLGRGGPVSFAFGPDGALYYTTYAGGGQVRRVAFVNNKSPVADLKASPDPAASPGGQTDPETGNVYGPTPLAINFDASDSSDPEGQNLTYEWDFDCPKTENGRCNFAQFTPDPTGGTMDPDHEYGTEGVYAAGLRVSDDKGNSDTAQVTVYVGNTAQPEPMIDPPETGETFVVGEEIGLSGSATDADGQTVELKWEVIRHHTAPNEHTHPSILDAADSTGGSVTFSAPGPEDLRSTDPDGNYLEVRLTATDSQGLSKTVSRDLKPETTNVRFATEPAGLYLSISGERVRAPRTLLAWEDSKLNVYAPPQKQDGRRYVLRSWSDGGDARHTITVPAERERYTAVFRRR